jgi:hypothetical protein
LDWVGKADEIVIKPYLDDFKNDAGLIKTHPSTTLRESWEKKIINNKKKKKSTFFFFFYFRK